MNRRLHTLSDVANQLGLHDALDAPVRWLSDQIRAKRLPAHKVGRAWMMTDAEIEATLAVLEHKPVAGSRTATAPRELSLTATSARRRTA